MHRGLQLRSLIPTSLLCLSLGCGGGGGGGDAQPGLAPTNQAPIAVAEAVSIADGGVRIELDASASSDSDGVVSSYLWTQSAGPEVEILDADAARASIVTPRLPDDAQLRFTVRVQDNEGASATASVGVTVRGTPGLRLVTLGGELGASASQSLDGDTNDPLNPLRSNDDPQQPQDIPNPTILGGYVNEPGAGAPGRSLDSGDREDYFRVELLAGQRVSLVIAEFQDADADLYLFSEDGELLDFSIDTGPNEIVQIPATGTYVVNVSIFAGATNYSLAVGASLTPETAPAEIVPDQLLLSLRDGADTTEDENLRRRMDLRSLAGAANRTRLMALENAAQNEFVLRQRLGRQRARLDAFADSAQARRWTTLMSIKQIARLPQVAAAEPNYRLQSFAAVNDSAYPLQWHYPLINVPGAWDTSVGDSSVTVAVIDTGILSGHPDLRGQLVPGYDFIRDPREAADGNGIDPDPEETIGGADPAAVNFHGTHVAGTIGARGNNGTGVAGVAYGARVMPVRAINASGGTLYDVNQAVRFAAGLDNDSGTLPAQPAQIINLSLGGGGFSALSQALYDELLDRGIIVVAAAGNESSSLPSYPASYRGVISVSAVDSQGRLARYSNTGAGIDVAAPGGDGSVDFNGDGYPDGVLSTGSSDGEFAYTFLSGTSMATPHVAGVLALMKSVNPAIDGRDIERLLAAGALTQDLGAPGRDDLYGHGLIDARKAIEAALAEQGGASNSEPRLSASSSALNFGSLGTRIELALGNSGGGELRDVRLSTTEDWLRITPLNVDAQGLGRYSISVDRSSLGPGVYEGGIEVRSSANDLRIRVLVSVASNATVDLGQVYLILYDPATDAVVAQAVAVAAENGYRYEFPPVAEGSYQIFAGTDIDNDFLICDAGEACGAFLTIDQPLTITVQADRDDLSFPIEYLIALPGLGAASAQGLHPSPPRLQRAPDHP